MRSIASWRVAGFSHSTVLPASRTASQMLFSPCLGSPTADQSTATYPSKSLMFPLRYVSKRRTLSSVRSLTVHSPLLLLSSKLSKSRVASQFNLRRALSSRSRSAARAAASPRRTCSQASRITAHAIGVSRSDHGRKIAPTRAPEKMTHVENCSHGDSRRRRRAARSRRVTFPGPGWRAFSTGPRWVRRR